MEIPISAAKGQLTDLVRRAEAGNEVILTRHGRPVARLAPVKAAPDRATRRRVMEAAARVGAAKAVQGASAARSQDFLYDDRGLPE
jgi:prevent-host-death family protein